MDFSGNDILTKIKSGDTSVFETLYRFFHPRLKYFANQYLHDPETAKNIAQDVFAELWDNRNNFHDDTNIQAWLFTVAKNKSLKVLSKIKSQQNYDNYIRTRQIELDYKALADFDTDDFLFDELQNKIKTALEKLPPACRKIFEMSRFEDKKNREIAEELGISIKTVEAQITKAMRFLKNDLKDYLPLFYIFFFYK